MLKIGLLQCDRIDEQLHCHSGGDYPDMFTRLLDQTEQPYNLQCFDVTEGQLPANTPDFDGFIITGSRHSTYEAADWIQTLTTFVQNCSDIPKIKVIGVCFGHQLIAHALGGNVTLAPQGWGIGLHAVNIREKQPWMEPSKTEINLVFSHQDQVISAPKNAKIIAESQHCAIQMYTIGTQFLGIQGHPEMTKPHIQAIITRQINAIAPQILQSAHNSLTQLSNDGDIVGQWIMRFLLR